MPIYEFVCSKCGKKYATLVGMTSQPDDDSCPNCGASPQRKIVSRPGRFRTEDARVDELADRLDRVGEPDSPAVMRDMVREMGKAMDDDMADEMEEMFEADLEGKIDDED